MQRLKRTVEVAPPTLPGQVVLVRYRDAPVADSGVGSWVAEAGVGSSGDSGAEAGAALWDGQSDTDAALSDASAGDGCAGFGLLYERNMSAVGPNGVRVTLTATEPEPPGVGRNDWTACVESENGEPIEEARTAFTPFMPQHGHSSPTRASTAEQGGGYYDIDNIDFIMPGYWRNTVTISHATHDDVVELHLCLE